VKHSDVEAEPTAAEKLCGDALPTLRLFALHLAQWGEELGLVGPRELDRLWTRHILNSALVAHKVGPGTLIDIGSGAGFPGLVVAAMRPDVQCILIEPLGRRAHWLREEAERLGLSNVSVRMSGRKRQPGTSWQSTSQPALSAPSKPWCRSRHRF
jgi:16S rRNA (guanine527-N7)-methyltransferase